MSARILIDARPTSACSTDAGAQILGYGNQGAARARNLRDFLHSHTSQYGRLRALTVLDTDDLATRQRTVPHDDILFGRFAREWSAVDPEKQLAALRDRAERHPLTAVERAVMDKEAHR